MSETVADKPRTPSQAQETIIQMVDARAEQYGNRVVIQSSKDGSSLDVTWERLTSTYQDVAQGLIQLGLGQDDAMAILSENRREWVFADLGIYATRGVVVPVYHTLTPAQTRNILKDCSARAIFVSNADFLERILQIRDELPELGTIIIFDPEPSVTLPEGVLSFQELISRGREASPEVCERLSRSITQGRGSDLATIIYTSGTMGEPKGVVLTHDNFLSNLRSILESIEITESDSCVSLLPLSHIFERSALYLFLYAGGLIHYAGGTEAAVDKMPEVKPTILFSVPRFYEKEFARIQDRMRESSLVRRLVFASCLKMGSKFSRRLQARQSPDGALGIGRRIADKLVFAKLRDNFGGRTRFMISGGAPLDKDIAEFFQAAGLLILEGYGQTEASPVISINRVDSFRFGTVGRVISGAGARIAEDGEILAKGPNIMKEYYKRPDETAEAIDADGWLHTGDIGHFDDDGFLVITDRKKAIIVTASGMNVAPAAIESALTADRLIHQVVAYGDARKFISALIVPRWEQIEKYAVEHKVPFTSRAELVDNLVIKDLIQRHIDTAMEGFAPYEQVKKFKLLEKELSQEDGELTPTFKIKRREIIRRHWNELDSLYQD